MRGPLRYIEVHAKVLDATFVCMGVRTRPQIVSALYTKWYKFLAYAIGLFLDHLLPVGSPNALIV